MLQEIILRDKSVCDKMLKSLITVCDKKLFSVISLYDSVWQAVKLITAYCKNCSIIQPICCKWKRIIEATITTSNLCIKLVVVLFVNTYMVTSINLATMLPSIFLVCEKNARRIRSHQSRFGLTLQEDPIMFPNASVPAILNSSARSWKQ